MALNCAKKRTLLLILNSNLSVFYVNVSDSIDLGFGDTILPTRLKHSDCSFGNRYALSPMCARRHVLSNKLINVLNSLNYYLESELSTKGDCLLLQGGHLYDHKGGYY